MAPTVAPMDPTPFMKKCPRCEKTLFADLDRCYDCLYDYNNPSLDYAGSGMGSGSLSDSVEGMPMGEPMMAEAGPEPYLQADSSFESGAGGMAYGDVGSPCDSHETDAACETVADGWTADEREVGFEPSSWAEPEPLPEPVPSPTAVDLRQEVRPSSAGSDGVDGGSEPVGETPALERDRRQDVGLFAEKSESDRPLPSAPSPDRDEVRLGVLVHWRGLEMTAALRDGRLTIGRDRSNDIAIASFDVPPFAAAIEAEDGGARVCLLADAAKARLDGAPIDRTAHLDASRELDLYGARLSLVRLD